MSKRPTQKLKLQHRSQPLKRASKWPVWADVGARLSLAFFLIGIVVLVHWIDREGLIDHHDGHISFLDVVYFTMISVTTTGFGDIAPIPPGAKIISAIVSPDGGGTTVTTTLELGTDDLKASMAFGTATAIALTGVECAASWATNASAEALLRFAYTSVSGPAACVHQFAITYAMP